VIQISVHDASTFFAGQDRPSAEDRGRAAVDLSH
jgi:hypothetical protein